MTVRRVLVTGSRNWPWPATVTAALDAQRARLRAGDVLVVVVGYDPGRDYPPGVDRIAYRWARHHQRNPAAGLAAVAVEPHPADWQTCAPDCNPRDHGHRLATRGGKLTHCPTAGFRRNGEMVDSGADVALAFCLDDSHGTLDCLGRIRAARMNVAAQFAYTPAA